MPFIDRFINLTVGLVPAAIVAQGLGSPAYLAIESTAPIAGDITTVSSASDVADLLTATQISAQAAADLTDAFSQDRAPTSIIVATYDVGSAETPDDALDRLEAAETDFGVIFQESRTDVDNSAVATWLAASQFRRWAHPFVAQSASADLITSGKPAALTACEIDAVAMHYHNDATQGQAAAHAGQIGGYPLIDGPMAYRVRLQGVDLPTATSAEKAFARENDAAILKPLGLGSSASQRLPDQTRAYSGNGWTGILTLMYTVRRSLAVLQNIVESHALSGDPLFANTVGAAEVSAALSELLAGLFDVGHFQAGNSGSAPNQVALPKGYRVDVTTAGTVITAAVTVLIGQEARTLNLNIIGEEQ